MYDYFYGQQAELFSFYRVPKVLFTDEKFSNISSDAKLLYGIMLDRMNLSAKNGWVDELGRVYIIFTIEEIKGALGCAEKKAVKLLHELENRCGLIERKRIGLGKPNYIYVKNFVDNSVERQFLNCQKDKVIILILKILSIVILILSYLPIFLEGMWKRMRNFRATISIFMKNLKWTIFSGNFPMIKKSWKAFWKYWLKPYVANES